MLRSIWMWVLSKIFKTPTETKQKEVEDNLKYAVEYENIENINFNSIFSNKLANYSICDSSMTIEGNNKRVDLLNMIGQSMWKNGKKIVSMSLGYGGLFLVPYVKGNKLFYNLVPQNRVTIDSTEGDLITGATILAERKEISLGLGQTKTYIRWTNYKLKNGNCIIEQKFSDENGEQIKETPSFWNNIKLKEVIGNVDRALFGYIKSPINNRRTNSKYGVPITYGCESTIKEIKETMKQLLDEFRLKRPFVGADATMFNGKDALPLNGLFKKVDSNNDSFFEVFDPAFRSYTERLQELYKRLEHEVGTSYGILSEVDTNNATATEIKRSMFDTFTLCDDIRINVEKGLNDFFYACNVLANAANLTPNGEYKIKFDWSYSLLEDTDTEWQQLTWANKNGIISDVEIRQWIKPKEDIKDSEKAIEEIRESQANIDDILGTRGEE